MIDIPALVVRDGILVGVWLTAVYLVFMLLGLSQLSRHNAIPNSVSSTFTLDAPELESARATWMDQPADAKTEAQTLRISPRYEVAVSLAFQGFDVASIAHRCDISVAEARLVATLGQSYQGLEKNVEEWRGRPHRTRVAA